jgi:PIN domain nuclease of toxin-antitoxin system
MAEIVVDTHVVIWYFAEPNRLTPRATETVDDAEANGVIYVSAITVIELIYLVEKKRIPGDVLDLLRSALSDPATAYQIVGLDRPIADAVQRIPYHSVPDMPDRIIAATALHLNLPLVTRDSQIQSAALIKTVW